MYDKFALNRNGYPELQSNGGIEACPGCRGMLEPGAMEQPEVVAEAFGCDTAPFAQKGFESLMRAVDGLNVQFATDALASRLVQDLVRDIHLGGTARQRLAAIGTSRAFLLRTGSSTPLIASSVSTGKTAPGRPFSARSQAREPL